MRFSFVLVLIQCSGVVRTKCVQEVDAKHLSFLPGPEPPLAIHVGDFFSRLLRCCQLHTSARDGTELLAAKVCFCHHPPV